jgi:hypothetical protein
MALSQGYRDLSISLQSHYWTRKSIVKSFLEINESLKEMI